ncbi:MAG: hypothetical protein J6J31_03970 [Thermoguttaceae bacterium]|nr:hypothetical protein [Thermoguttaceae bacterium]
MMPHLERIHSNSDWLLPILIFSVMCWLVWKIYRRDSVELPPFWRIALPILRTGVLLVLFWIYLQPQWVTEKERKVNSRFVVFCDTSLSMTLPNSSAQDSPTRSEALVKLWGSSPILRQLNTRHDLLFLTSDSEARPIWTLEKGALAKLPSTERNSSSKEMLPGTQNEIQAAPSENAGEKTSQTQGPAQSAETIQLPDWEKLLIPQGKESRQSDSIREWILTQRESPIAGILLCSDGVQNSGGENSALIETARKQGIPIFTLGFGSQTPVANARLTELEAPARIMPKDPFLLRGSVEGTGFQTAQDPQAVCEMQVDLFQKRIPDAASESTLKADAAPSVPENGAEEVLVETLPVTLTAEGRQTVFEFRVKPQAVGKYLYTVRVRPLDGETELDDNQRETEVDVMERKTRILIFAGGPMREYQFIAASLFRDKSIETDVLLQSALPPESAMPKNAEEETALRNQIQQDADRVLLRFPQTREELFAYDGIVAVDPDWSILTPAQTEWVEEWTSRHGGGIVFIAGPVFMGRVGGWMDDPELEKIRTLCPVEFFDRTSSMRQNTFTADEIWPLDWSRAGREAAYLQLDEQSATSERIWAEFPGVYGHFPTKKLRPGATALASFSNPQARFGDAAPILLATQFYGAGRTFYVGTGEFWRLRALDPEYFTRFYAQIIHYVTQGRTLQQSRRGRLMLEQTRFFPGMPIEIRAQLFDPALQPLEAVSVPEVSAEIFLPNGRIQALTLRADNAMPGLYAGRFTVLTEGRFRVELPIPDSSERLVQRAEIILSDLERSVPLRDQRFLNVLAQETGGMAFESPDEPEFLTFPETVRDRTRTLVEFDSASPVIPPEILLYVLVALLSLEWLIRRLLKLA